MKKLLFLIALVVIILSLVCCAYADDWISFLLKDPWGSSMKDITSSMDMGKSKSGGADVITYYPSIAGFNEYKLIYSNDALVGAIVSVNYPSNEMTDRYLILVRDLNDAFGQGYSGLEYDRFLIAIRNFCLECDLPLDYFNLAGYGFSDSSMIWQGSQTIAIALLNDMNTCTLFFMPSESRIAEIRQKKSTVDGFNFRGVTWGSSKEDVEKMEGSKGRLIQTEPIETVEYRVNKGNISYDVFYLFLEDKLMGAYSQAVKYYEDGVYGPLFNKYGNPGEGNVEELVSFLKGFMNEKFVENTSKRKWVSCWKPDETTTIYYLGGGDWRHAFYCPNDNTLRNIGLVQYADGLKKGLNEAEQEKKAFYEQGELYLKNGEYEAAAESFKKAGKYGDAEERIFVIYYDLGLKALSDERWDDALNEFAKAGNYKDAIEQALKCHYRLAEKALAEGKWDEASYEFLLADDYLDASLRIKEPYYKKAEILLEEEKYEAAIEAFKKADGYGDSIVRINEIHYLLAEKAYSQENYDVAIDQYRAAGNYKEANTKAKKICYNQGEKCLAAKDYKQAVNWFIKAGDYSDSEEQVIKIRNDLAYEALVDGRWEDAIGAHVLFGSYEQDGDLEDGLEDIEWIVLDIKDGKAVLLSALALDALEYNKKAVNSSWQNSYIRNWLNGNFWKSAFNKDEKAAIQKSKIDINDSFVTGKKKAKYSTEKVYLVNHDEYATYKLNDSNMKCKPTAYVVEQGIEVKSGYVDWWCRTAGESDRKMAFCIEPSNYFKATDVTSKLGIRPMICVKADYFMKDQ